MVFTVTVTVDGIHPPKRRVMSTATTGIRRCLLMSTVNVYRCLLTTTSGGRH